MCYSYGMDTIKKPVNRIISDRRNELGLTQLQIAKFCNVSEATVSRWESGNIANMGRDKISALSTILRISPGVIAGYEAQRSIDEHEVGRVVSFRIVNAVKCGFGSAPVEDYSDEYEQIPANMLNGYATSDCKVVRVTGLSMYPRIMEGDKVLVHIQPDVDSGDVALILYNGGEDATLKKVEKGQGYIELIPANPEFPPRRIEGTELLDCRIYGKVIKLIRDF